MSIASLCVCVRVYQQKTKYRTCKGFESEFSITIPAVYYFISIQHLHISSVHHIVRENLLSILTSLMHTIMNMSKDSEEEKKNM